MTTRPENSYIKVKVVPGASRSRVMGWLGDELKLTVSTAPEKGKANRHVEKLLATALGIPAKRVKVVRGQTSPHKMVELESVDTEKLKQTFGEPDVG